MSKIYTHYQIQFLSLVLTVVVSVALISTWSISRERATALTYILKSNTVILSNLFLHHIPDFITNFKTNSNIIATLEAENSNLRMQLLSNEQQLARYNQLENQVLGLEKALGVVNNKQITYLITSTMIDHSLLINPSVNNNLLINAGSEQGIEDGNLVISNKGVVGYIKQTLNNSAIVITTKDAAFKISGVTKTSGVNLIISGALEGNTMFYAEDVDLIDGETVYTSGMEGYFPAYVPIGSLHYENNLWSLRFFENFSSIQYIHVVK